MSKINTVVELKAIAKSMGLKGYSALRKQELIDYINSEKNLEEKESSKQFYINEISRSLILDLENIVYSYLTLEDIMTQFSDNEFREELIKKYYPQILKYRSKFYQNKIDWNWLSRNPNAIKLLSQNFDKNNWDNLSVNPNAIELLSQNLDKINWDYLSGNPNAIELLSQNPDKINWYYLSGNPNAIELLSQNLDKINWGMLSGNLNAIHLLLQHPDKIDWDDLSVNPKAIEVLEQNLDKINWDMLSSNPNAIHLIEAII
jgi:hypothetical protein